MKSLFMFLLSIIVIPCLGQTTDWKRIGQGTRYIVDVNLNSIKRSGDNISVVSRFLPRSSRADKAIEEKGYSTIQVKPTFIKLVQGTYNCKTLTGSGNKESEFDTNMNEVASSQQGDGWTAEDERKLVLDFVCSQ